MIITKVVEVGLDISNPIDIFADIEGNLMSILVSEYENRCFRSCFVRKVLRILQYSECVIAQEGDRCNGKMNVKFEVEAIVYHRGEIINGCVIKNKDRSGVIIAASPYASIFLNTHPSLATVAVGQIISVRVGNAEYRHGYMTVSVNAIPFIFTKEYPVYYMPRDNLTPEELEFLRETLTKIETEEKELAEISKKNTKQKEFFDTLLYAYKADQPVPAKATTVDVLSAVRKNAGLAGYLARDHRLRPSTPNVYRYTSPKDVPDPDAAKIRKELPPADVILTLLEDYAGTLRTIREMMSVYNSEKLMTDHKNIWLTLAKSRLG